MHTSKIGRKGKLAALFAAFAVVLTGAFSPLTAMADSTTANTLAELKAQINGASGARSITLGNDIAWDGQSIVIPAGKNITLYGDHTIFRDKDATTLNPMFDVKGTLTLGGKIKLSGKTGKCSDPQTTTPKVSGPFGGEKPAVSGPNTPKITTFWQQWPSDQKFGPLETEYEDEFGEKKFVGAKVIIGFRDIDRPVHGDDIPGVAYQYGDGRLFMTAEENVFEGITGPQAFPGRTGDSETIMVKRATKLKDDIDESKYVFTIENVDDDEWQAAYFRTNDGKYLGNPNPGILHAVQIVEKNATGYYKVEQQVNNDIISLKFQMSGPNWSVEKFFFPNASEANPVVVGALTTAQSYSQGHEGGKLWVEERNVEGAFDSDGTTPKLFHTEKAAEEWANAHPYWTVEGATEEDGSLTHFDSAAAANQWANEHATPQYWTVEGYDQHFPTQGEAQDWANDHTTTTPGACTIDSTCSKITTAMFNGSAGNEKGYFVQVSGNGVFNLQGEAELSNFLTGPNVSYVAPVVAKGGTVNIKGGKIHDNSAGYNADDSRNQNSANQIEEYIEKNLARTNTAGAVMYLGGAQGSITGGTIEDNRGDTGGIMVEGEGTSVTMDGGAINKNVGIHFGGGAYVHYGASFTMAGNATMTGNYAWDRGGAVYVSSQDYASSIVWPVIDPKEYKPATFVMDGNAVISGNYAVNRAGAVFVESHDVMLKSGQITGNFSRSLGGAIYVVGDGDARMYQLYVPNACVTGNTAVKGGVNAGPLNKALPNSTGDTCDVNNTLQNTGLLPGDQVAFAGHEGFGGGVWLCAFGGNATFGSGQDAQGNNANVVVAGNSAQPGQGSDMHLRPTKPGAGSGINVLNNYSDDKWVNEVNGKPIVVNQVYTGPLNVKNNGSAQCSGSMKIQGNYARVGGGIASDGTVVFGPAKDIYRVHGQLDVTKTWENVPEQDRKNIDLQLAVKEGETTYPLDGYKIRLDGTADVFDDENELQENDGKYNNESPAWESTPWNGTFGLPLVYTDNAGNTKPVFTFKDPDNASRTLNPAEPEDLPRLYELVTAKRLGTGNLTANLTIIETINGQAPTEYVYTQEDVTLDVNASADESKTLATKTYKDRAGNVIGVVNTNKLALNMHKNISNKIEEEKPTVEKYVNNDVHSDLVEFDKVFEYSIMAYVPKDATKVTISDTLTEDLLFVDLNGKVQGQDGFDATKLITNSKGVGKYDLIIEGSNNHQVNGTVKGHLDIDWFSKHAEQHLNGPIVNGGVQLSPDGKTITVTVNENELTANPANTKQLDAHGKWIVLSFRATINPDSYAKVAEQLGKTDGSVVAGLNWLKTDANKQGAMPGEDAPLVAALNTMIAPNDTVVRAIEGPSRLFALTQNGDYYATPMNDKSGETWVAPSAGDDFTANAQRRFNGTAIDNVRELVLKATPSDETANWPVLTDKVHDGLSNKARYTVVPTNGGSSTYETNTVTVKPETTQLKVAKNWNVNGSTAWPDDIKTVTFGIFDSNGNQVKTVDLEKGEAQPKTVSGLYKLQGITYTAKEISITDTNGNVKQVSGANNASATTGTVAVSDLLQFIANTVKETADNIDTFTTTNQTPQVEKYVNNNVHADIVNFDQIFEYSVMAYVPAEATKVEITDTLSDDLLFVDLNGKVQGQDGFNANNLITNSTGLGKFDLIIEGSNDHKVNGTVKGHSDTNWFSQHAEQHLNGPIRNGGVKLSADGKTITVTVNEGELVANPANRSQIDAHGKWIVLSFRATINPDSYTEVAKQVEAGADPVAGSSLSWQKITDDKTVTGGSKPHAGLDNTAKYKVYVGNNGTAESETNTVTVKPETTEVKVKKWWNGNASNPWPDDIKKVTFGIFDDKGEQVETIDLEKGEPQPKTKSGLPKLKKDPACVPSAEKQCESIEYTAKEISITTTGDEVKEVSGANDASVTDGVIKISDVLDYIASTIKDAEAYVALNEAPQVEKYVKNNVHAELEGFDEVFEYSVMAYVPHGATKVEITDTLTDDLLFVDVNGKVQGEDGFDATKLINNSSQTGYDLVIEPSNNHKVNGVVAGHSNSSWFVNHPERHVNGPIVNGGVQLSGDGKTITVTVNENELVANPANTKQEDAHGKWLVLSFRATINPDSYGKVAAQIKAGEDPAVSGLSWQKIEDDKTVTGGSKPHAGLDNTAKYKVYVGNEGSADYETNTVTVKPKTTKVYATKSWLDEKGEPMPWPDDVDSVTVKALDNEGNPAMEYVEDDENPGEYIPRPVVLTIKEDPNNPGTATVEVSGDLPKLEGVTYTVEEVAIPGYTPYGTVTGSGTDGDPYVFNNQKVGGPQIEKYINNGVHENLNAGFDTSFKYDIIAYVPNDADEIVIKDKLVDALEFAKAPADGKLSNQQTAAAEASTNPNEVVTSVVVKDDNNHQVGTKPAQYPNATVLAAGNDVRSKADITIDGKNLEVRFGSEDNPITAEDGLRGKYVQITFWAKYTQTMIDAAQVGNSQTITGNGAIIGGMNSHTGTINDASYDIRVGNDWEYDVKSNTVTVKGKDTQLEATKKWQNADGSTAGWPDGVDEVVIKVLKNGTPMGDDFNITLTKDSAIGKSKKLPVLVGVTYSLDEVEVPGYIKSVDATGTVFTNKDKGTPEIEKYINKDVDAHLVEFDRHFTYDILAFVPHDADEIVIKDTLVSSLEFADALGTASDDPDVVVESVVVKETNNHKAKGTVSSTDGADVRDKADITIADKNLVITFGSADNPITAADGLRGKWIQVTFTAKYTENAIKAAQVADSETINDNGTVISSITTHDGTTNTASYDVRVGNEWTRDVKSNTVTHDAETERVLAKKQWRNINDTDDIAWPSDVTEVKVDVLNSKTNEVVDTITLTRNQPEARSKALPKLIGVTYQIKEVPIFGYISTVDGNVVTNKDAGKPQIEKYINNNVHEDLNAGFDTSFKYDIMAYVPLDADSLEINDTLVDALEFAKAPAGGTLSNQQTAAAEASTIPAEVVTGIVAKPSNDHTVGGTVATADGAVALGDAAVASIDGKHLKVEIANAEAYRGQWIQVTFWAKYTQKMINAANVGNSDTITNNGTVLGGAASHDGTTNYATYKIEVRNDWSSDYKSNTVTVKGKSTQLGVKKAWNVNGSTAWPSEVESVTFGVFANDAPVMVNAEGTIVSPGTAGAKQMTVVLNENKTSDTVTGLPVLVGVTYSAKEIAVNDTTVSGADDASAATGVVNLGSLYSFIAKTVKETVNDVDLFTTTNEMPSIEKYINHDVDAHLETFDTGVTYDILAYVPLGADSVEINDSLVDALEFAKADGTASTVPSEVVTAIVAKASNNHTAGENGTVATDDGADVRDKADITIDNKNLVITFGSDTEPITDADGLRGKWIQVTFHAKYTQAAIDNAINVPVPDYEKITDNGTVLGGAASHDGTTNYATYKIKVGNESSSVHKSNTVTHDAETVDLRVAKRWNVGGSTAWPSEVESVTFGAFKTEGGTTTPVMADADGVIVSPNNEGAYPTGATQVAVELDKDNTSGTITGLPKLQGVTYSAKEIDASGPDGPLLYGDGNTATNGCLFEPRPDEEIITFIADTVRDGDLFTTTNEKPQIEKYINHDVDAHLVEFDKSFTYDILAYVPLGADSLVINDTLVDALKFDTGNTFTESGDAGVHKAVTAIVAKASNNHRAGENGTVATTSDSDTSLYDPYEGGNPAVPKISGDSRTLTVTINDAKPYRGQWIQVTFKAKYTQAAINAAAVDPAADNADVTDNGTVITDITEHDGTQNTASYKVKVGNRWTSDHKSNTVTHDAETVELKVEKKWNINGSDAWPEGIDTVTFGVFKTEGDTTKPVMVNAEGKIVSPNGEGAYPAGATQMTVELNKDKTSDTITIGLPKLQGITYSAKEIAVTDSDGNTSQVSGDASATTGVVNLGSLYSFIAKTVVEKVNDVDLFTTTNEIPQIEKYINHDVDAHLVEYDKVIDYDILAYVPLGADSLEINDSLVPSLEFADASGKASLDKTAVVKSVVAKETNDHKAKGTVSADNGTPVTNAAISFSPSGKNLNIEIADATAYRGQWIQVTFYAKYTGDAIKNVATTPVPDNADVTNNGLVISDITEHDGTANTASYKVKVGNDWTSDYNSNTVTHDAETVNLTVEKKWNVDGKTDWPEGVDTVTFGVFKTKDGTTTPVMVEVEGEQKPLTVELNKNKTSDTVAGLPKLKGVTYVAREIKVGETDVTYTDEKPNTALVKVSDVLEFIANTVKQTVSGVDWFTTTNEAPQIEKYINKDVDAHLVEYDKVMEYDIMAYVPLGADSLEINDPLVDSLEFSDASGNASTNKDLVVKSVVAKQTNDHKAKGTVATTDGTPLGDAAAISFADANKRLNVVIADATAYRGQWIQVTFYAKYTGDAIKNVATTPVPDNADVTDNGLVISDITEHDGTANTASYKVKVGNDWTSDYDSNTVTHDAETVTVSAEKQWKHADGRAMTTWPVDPVAIKVINDQTNEVVDTITLTQAQPKNSSKELPKLEGVTYKIVEADVPAGYTSTVDGQIVVNTAKKYDVEFSKRELGVDTEELEGAKIKVTGPDGFVEEWTSSADGPHTMQLEAGEYTFEEVSAPAGYDAITTKVTFTVDTDGKVTLKEAYENIGGKVSVKDTNHLILEDVPSKYPVEFSKRELGDDTKELEGAEIKVTDAEGNVVDEWTSGTESHKMELRAGEYTFEEVNAPEGFDKITTTVKFTVGTDGTVTLKEAYEDINGKVSVKDTNHLILEDVPSKYPVEFSKYELGDDTKELEGAEIKVTDAEGNVVDEWTSGTESHKLNLEAGEYTFEEVNAPEGFDKITTTVKFTVGTDGKVTLKEAYEDINGKVSVKDTNHLILEDIRHSVVSVTITKEWLNAMDWPVAAPALWPAGAEVTVNIKDGDTVVKTVVLNADNQSETVTDLPKLVGRDYTVEEVELEGVFALEDTTEITSDEDGNITAKLVNRLLPRKSEMSIEVAKVDEAGNALPGAKLRVTGPDDFEETWTTDGTNYLLPHIVPGTYVLEETEAPAQYDIAKPITFEVSLEGVVTVNGEPVDPLVIEMVDEKIEQGETEKPTPTPPNNSATPGDKKTGKTPNVRTNPLVRTGSPAGIAMLVAFGLMGAGGGMLVVRRRRS